MLYLYLKTHNKTGLKYLGKTKQNPFVYQGSGKYWKRHIEKHGYDVTTEILAECETNDEIKELGLYYSNKWNVVESSEFANLKIESGDGGWDHLTEEQIQSRYKDVRKNGGTFKGKTHTNKTKRKIREERAKQIFSDETKRKMSDSQKGKILSEEHKRKIGESNKGKQHTIKTKNKISKANKGRKTSDETKQKLSDSLKGKTRSEKTKQKMREAKLGTKLTEEHKRKLRGKTRSEKTKQKMREAKLGTKLTEEHKRKISESNRGVQKPKTQCPHCGKIGGVSQMKQWHFDNCKERIE